jgi:hypothetical protein
MSKPHEETWRWTKANDLVLEDGKMVANFWDHEAHRDTQHDQPKREAAYLADEARLRLAAQAPAMARLILGLLADSNLYPEEEAEARDILLAAGVLE